MMNLTVITVGKLKERYLVEGCAEYIKRLGGLCQIRMVEIPECKLSARPSPREMEQALAREGTMLLEKIPPGSFTVALCIEGEMLSSPACSQMLQNCAGTGKSSVVFIIGGSFGLAENVKKTMDLHLSMSRMTFPHQLARMMLLEQLYRAFSILQGGKYHK